MRIVSLLPAATEIVWALGLEDDLVGVSHACDFPPGVSGRPVVTRPSGADAGRPSHESVDAAALAELRPNVVFTGAGPRAWDAGADVTVVVLDPASVEGILHAIATVGAMTDAEDEAVGLVEILRERLADVEEVAARRRDDGHHAPRVVALDGLAPLSSAGLWVPEQVRRAGGWEVLGNDGEPSVPATWEAVAEVDPEMVLLVPHGMHLGEVTRAWSTTSRPAFAADIQAVRRGRVFALDAAAYFSRPGPRVIDGIEILAEIFDPVAFVDLAPEGSWVPVL
jgi:iron complex transport system substrate-binding protein